MSRKVMIFRDITESGLEEKINRLALNFKIIQISYANANEYDKFYSAMVLYEN